MDRFHKFHIAHILFWVATISFHVFTRWSIIGQAGLFQFLGEIIVRNGLLAIIIYANLLILIPRYARTNEWGKYIIFLLIDFSFYVGLKNAHDVYLFGHLMHKAPYLDFFHNTFYNFSIALFYVAFSVALQLSREWVVQRHLIQKIEVEKLHTELNYLRAQINPHFLFNSINTIFFQIDKENKTARETLSSFSDMLRYQLYECNGDEIPVEREITYLKNYVDLQRHRCDENYWISFSNNNVEGLTIAPLLLIPFVENAFKHVSHFPQDNEIRIDVYKSGTTLHMMVFNTFDEDSVVEANEHGIGLKNVQRRLELLYHNRHNLQFRRRKNSFQVDLEILLHAS